MENRQTAIEYLVKQLFPRALSAEEQYYIEKAKQMEKVHTLKLIAFMRTQDKMGKSIKDLYEEYYNENSKPE